MAPTSATARPGLDDGDARAKSRTRAPSSETVVRFDVHQRLQHGLMAISFTLLVLTGWPISAHGIGASRFLVKLFGGLEGCSLAHRLAAAGLIIAALYHLFYLMLLLKRRAFRLSMLPSPRDARDLVGNVLYLMGLRQHRPRFPRYTYFEKFDYWAVFWGVVIMVGSGFVRWFPDATTSVFPAWVYEIAHYAHADEALLALLAIFIWHFYNVHLRPGVFPMSRVFLTGRLTLEALRHEHGEEYDALIKKRAEGGEKTKTEDQEGAA